MGLLVWVQSRPANHCWCSTNKLATRLERQMEAAQSIPTRDNVAHSRVNHHQVLLGNWNILTRGGVLEDVLGLEDVLEDTFWSPWPWPWPRRSSPWPWPWPRSLKSSKIALSSARGQYYFLNSWNFVEKRQKPRGKFASTFFVFLTWSIDVAKGRMAGGPPLPNWNFTNDKNVTKKPYSSFGFSFLLAFFVYNSITITTILKARGAGSPSILFLPANLNV